MLGPAHGVCRVYGEDLANVGKVKKPAGNFVKVLVDQFDWLPNDTASPSKSSGRSAASSP
jgi:hypothetical protein